VRQSEGEAAARNAVSAREADLSETRIRLAEKEHELMDHQREVHRVESEVSRLEARAEVAVSQLKGLDEREERIGAERALLGREESELTAQASSLQEEQANLRRELETLREELRTLEAAFQAKADKSQALEASIEHERTRLFDIQAGISHNNNKLSRLEERRAALEVRARRAAEEEQETREKLSETGLDVEKKRMELDSLRASQAELEAERQSAVESLEETRSLLKRFEQELSQGREEYSLKNSRLQSLKELEENLEGYGEGVKALISEKKQGTITGIHGLVADLIQTRPEHEKAVEAVLGDRLQHLIVDGHSTAKQALEYLKTKNFGRGTFLPISPRGTDAVSATPSNQGVVGRANELVTIKDGYSDAVKALLGRVLVVESIDAALAIWESGFGDTLVTLDGEVIEPGGSVSGGGASSGGLLSKKREIRELTTEVENLEKKNQAAEDRLAETKSTVETTEASLRELNELINEKKITVVGAEKDSFALQAELERVGKKMEILDIEAAQRDQEEQEIREGLELVKVEIETLYSDKARKESAVFESQEELKTVKEDLEREREGLTSKKMDMSALIQRHESSARDIKRADLQKEELDRKKSRLDLEKAEIDQRRIELNSGRKEAEDNINELMKTAIEMKERVPALQEAYEEANSAIVGLEEAVRVGRRESEAAREALTQLELKRAELKLKMEHLEETVHHNYHIQINDIDDEIKAMEIDRDETEMNAAEIRIKVERLGPVNIGAIEEYNELMERFTFLNTQKEDLDASVARLKEAIGKINKTSEELFMDAFNAVNETFKTIFVTLFNGGRAELLLVTPESGDILESGLEIAAQPPGKKLQSLLLCSGGEKAMIAAALTFACFLVKPSPFCVLDEVDAPLDESNVQRFGNMLKEFADKTQFIVITHSRPTMELADALYGVTMDEPGVSRLVSVRLKEAEELAEV
jgi:chromosome segregation protein